MSLLIIPGAMGLLPPAILLGVVAFFASARSLKALPEEDIFRFRKLTAALPAPLVSPAGRISTSSRHE